MMDKLLGLCPITLKGEPPSDDPENFGNYRCKEHWAVFLRWMDD